MINKNEEARYEWVIAVRAADGDGRVTDVFHEPTKAMAFEVARQLRAEGHKCKVTKKRTFLETSDDV